jgi:hypothetical protein
MTQTLTIPDHNSCNFATEETNWPVFNHNQELCGRIYFIDRSAVPLEVYRELELPNHLDLYITSEGHWASTLKTAELYLLCTKPPLDFLVRGSCLSLFAALEWSPNAHNNYRIYRRWDGTGFDVEEVEEIKAIEEESLETADFAYF